jgi:hypothetical protein
LSVIVVVVVASVSTSIIRNRKVCMINQASETVSVFGAKEESGMKLTDCII